MRWIKCIVYVSTVLACGLLISGVIANTEQDNTDDEDYTDITPAPQSSTSSPPLGDGVVASSSMGEGEPLVPICPPKPPIEDKSAGVSNVLLVSTLDGQLSALDLSKDGEMLWSVSMYPGTLLDSTISLMDLDNRGYFVKLIPSLTGRLYKFDGEVVEQIPMDVDSLLGSSQKMQENIVITGGKETRTYGIDAKTGEVLYECSMNECNKFKESSLQDMFVVQCNTKTVRAHAPKTGEQKWNFSVSLHDVSFYPANDPCENKDEEDDLENESEALVEDNIKTVVPEGIVCATRDDSSLKWKRKFQAPIVDVWQLNGKKISKVNLFSKSHIPRRDGLLDDSEADDNPTLYIGRHNNQLYIQESISLLMGSMIGEDHSINQLDFPKVSWKPYMVSPSRTPIINHGPVDGSNQLTPAYDPVMHREDSRVTALALTSGNTEYPFDSGFYLYTETAPDLDPDDPVTNITSLLGGQPGGRDSSLEDEETTVELIYMSLWHWWKEVVVIAVVTAIMTNFLITGPIVHNLRDDFQEWSRQLVTHVETLQRERNTQEIVSVYVDNPMPGLTNNTGSTPSSAGTLSASGPDFSGYSRQGSDFESRFQSDFEPVQCLGKGGFGIVFECKNKYDDVHYAVKRITLPSSEESKTKVMREVKLHAKLDHKHIVRFYSTWMENPPPGWQTTADSWFNEDELGSGGPTNLDPTQTEYSTEENVKVLKRGNRNPFYQYSMTSQTSSGGGDAFNQGDANYCHQLDKDDSFSVRFEYSNCDKDYDNDTSASYNHTKDYDNDTSASYNHTKDNADDTSDQSINANDNCDKSRTQDLSEISFGGFSEPSGVSPFDFNYDYEDSTGGIQFAAASSYTEGIEEVNGRKEAVSLDLEEESAPEGSVNSDCCDALVWDSKELKEKKSTTKNQSFLYIVMQLCRKDTLRDWLRSTTSRTQTEILGFFSQICVGVEYVHRKGLIHRDLKPSNIYFSHDGVVKIGDFGLVTGGSLLPLEHLTPGPVGDQDISRSCLYDQLTDQVGTQMYMSPEQLAQQAYNHKVDIYSLGLIFLELCVCFSTQMERVQTLSAAKKQLFPEAINNDTNVKQLLAKMLNRSPDLRPEADNILELDWLQDLEESPSITKRKRIESSSLYLETVTNVE